MEGAKVPVESLVGAHLFPSLVGKCNDIVVFVGAKKKEAETG